MSQAAQSVAGRVRRRFSERAVIQWLRGGDLALLRPAFTSAASLWTRCKACRPRRSPAPGIQQVRSSPLSVRPPFATPSSPTRACRCSSPSRRAPALWRPRTCPCRPISSGRPWNSTTIRSRRCSSFGGRLPGGCRFRNRRFRLPCPSRWRSSAGGFSGGVGGWNVVRCCRGSSCSGRNC